MIENLEVPKDQNEDVEINALNESILASLSKLAESQQESPLDSALKLGPPADPQSRIEYNQVFQLVPNRSFYSLYKQCYQSAYSDDMSNAMMNKDSYLRDQVKLIDGRPKRWVKMIKDLVDRVNELVFHQTMTNNDMNLLKGILTKFGPEKFDAKQNEYNALMERYKETYRKSQDIAQFINNIGQEIWKTINVINAAGYIYHYDKDKGPTISLPIPDKMADPPLKDLPTTKVSTDEIWNKLLTQLTNALFQTNKLVTSPTKIQQFQLGAQDLKSVDTCTTIQAYVAQTKKDIAALDQEISNLKIVRDNDTEGVVTNATANLKVGITNCNIAINNYNTVLTNAKAYVKLSPIGKLIPETDPRFNALVNAYFVAVKLPYTVEGILTQINVLTNYIQQYTKDITDIKQTYTNTMNAKINDRESKKATILAQLQGYDKNQVLLVERTQFLLYWNNPTIYDAKVSEQLIDTTGDPLSDYYGKLNRPRLDNSKPYSIHEFKFNGDGYYDKENRSLREFMEFPNLSEQVALFPYIENDGQPSKDSWVGVIAPRKPGLASPPKMPTVKFVETHELNISYVHDALGELKSSINLSPGEKKEIVVLKQTKLTQTINESRKSSDEQKRNVSSSFEDNLTNELSNSFNMSLSDQNSRALKSEQKEGSSYESQFENNSSSDTSAKASASGSFLDGLFSASGEASYSANKSKKALEKNSAQAALALSQSEDAQTLSKQSRETSLKNTYKRINRVATETSSNNKTDIASSSSQQFEEDVSNKETLSFSNPNEGRTINFNLFQLQNVYKSKVELKDVKIVVNTGIELVEGTNIPDIKVYELERFNKIYKDCNQSDVGTILCALIARRVLRNYTNIIKALPDNDGVLKVKLNSPAENEQLMLADLLSISKKLDLCFSISQDENSNALKTKIGDLQSTLFTLQKFGFVFNKTVLSESEHVVNAPALHMETQMGLVPSTEPYLEDQRQIALEKKKAEVNRINAEADYWRGLKPRGEVKSPNNKINFFDVKSIEQPNSTIPAPAKSTISPPTKSTISAPSDSTISAPSITQATPKG